MIAIDDNDIHSASLCAWKEARGEGLYGCFLVLDVVRNRAGAPGFGKTIHDVVYGKNQFTSMSVPSDPEFNLEPSVDDVIFPVLLAGAPKILEDSNPATDATHGALYYSNEKTATSGWYYRNIIMNPAHPVLLVYKNHTFRA